jgi:hypothetical protein
VIEAKTELPPVPPWLLSTLAPPAPTVTVNAVPPVAEKDVPEGVPYKIVDVSEIPSDRAFRDAWEIDEAELTDGFGGSITSFDEG